VCLLYQQDAEHTGGLRGDKVHSVMVGVVSACGTAPRTVAQLIGLGVNQFRLVV